ncbi:hypothetical protein BH10CYA1_BH10CYA1_52960 [soil metagenome]
MPKTITKANFMTNRSTAVAIAFLVLCTILLSTSALDKAEAKSMDSDSAPNQRYGVNANLSDVKIFPNTSAWNEDISKSEVSPDSDTYIKSLGINTHVHPDFGTVWNKQPWGIPYVVVPGSQRRLPVKFGYSSESDPGPYPIPINPPIEGGPNSTQDRHVLIVDRDNEKLYELFNVFPPDISHPVWRADSGAIFDLRKSVLRQEGFTSADAAGLPILPGLVRFDEVCEQKEIRHALRFTASRTRRAYISPARHFASLITDKTVPPMGLRVRLKSSFDISGFPPSAQVILKALKKYGMFLADNGKDWFISGAPDERWNDAAIHSLAAVTGKDFEVVSTFPASDEH